MEELLTLKTNSKQAWKIAEGATFLGRSIFLECTRLKEHNSPSQTSPQSPYCHNLQIGKGSAVIQLLGKVDKMHSRIGWCQPRGLHCSSSPCICTNYCTIGHYGIVKTECIRTAGISHGKSTVQHVLPLCLFDRPHLHDQQPRHLMPNNAKTKWKQLPFGARVCK